MGLIRKIARFLKLSGPFSAEVVQFRLGIAAPQHLHEGRRRDEIADGIVRQDGDSRTRGEFLSDEPNHSGRVYLLPV